MISVLRLSWPLLLGMFLLQIGNGLQGSLMGVRGAIEGFSTFELSFVAQFMICIFKISTISYGLKDLYTC